MCHCDEPPRAGPPTARDYREAFDGPTHVIEQDSQLRKEMPMARGLLDYFPAALAEVARVSVIGNLKHNPGCEMHHARGKSMDHADCVVRHLAERGGFDEVNIGGKIYKVRHSAYAAWRALALLQQELEDDNVVVPPRAAHFDAGSAK